LRQETDDEIVAAAMLANADAFITKLPEGYDAMLGERGALLTCGQMQRIRIARAVVWNRRILWLDEATSSLDAPSEMAV
jgi:ABC-type bacteriocin/lantibiotic exporter with double-glycine peptidase domain